MSATAMTYRPAILTLRFLQGVVVLGGITLVAGLLQAPQRTWVSILLFSYYLVGLGLGGLLMVALHYVTGARWSVPIRRVPEAMTSVLPLAAIGLLAAFLCQPGLYSWSTPEYANGIHSPLQHLWLSRPFFLIRAVLYLAVWMAFATAVVRTSRRQDSSADSAPTSRNVRLSAAFLVAFGITCWLASCDWIMSLEPDWASTIFGVYSFAGLFLSALAAAILLVLYLRQNSSLKSAVNFEQLHDLGTLLFSFSCFWMYTWFCQYMLIWYVNNPEETVYYRVRWQGNWPVLLFLDLGLNWAVPFCVLLFRSAKRSPVILGSVAFVVLVGRWVDLSLMILPTQAGASVVPGAIEVGLLVGTVGLFILVVFRALGQASLVPPEEHAR
jgi:hypothetical protein